MNKVDSNNYIHTTLGELVSKEKKSIISGPFGSNIGKIFFKEKGIPVIRGNNLSTGGEKFKDDGFVFITREKADELNCYAIKNDLIFTAVGTIGQVGIIDEKLKYDEYVISNKQLRVRFDNKKITPLFAYYWFSSYWIQKLILQRNIGSTVPLINLSVLKGLPITLPKSISVQNGIVEVLENISIKIDLNNRINTELEAMAKTLYDYWFVQFDFPNEEGMPYKSSGGKMVWSEELKREIPEGWEVGSLNDNIDLILDHRGKTPKKLGGDWVQGPNGVVALSAKIVKRGKLVNLEQANKVSHEMYEKWMPEKLKSGDILMTSEAPLGEFYFILSDTNYCMSQRLFAIRAERSKVFPVYLYFELSKGNGYSQIIGSQSGSTVFGIRQDELRKIKILKPKIKTQKRFDEIVTPILSLIRNKDAENQHLSQLRDWLLPMLMNGQVKVQ